MWRFIAKLATFGGRLATRIWPWRLAPKPRNLATFGNFGILFSKSSEKCRFSKYFPDFWKIFFKLPKSKGDLKRPKTASKPQNSALIFLAPNLATFGQKLAILQKNYLVTLVVVEKASSSESMQHISWLENWKTAIHTHTLNFRYKLPRRCQLSFSFVLTFLNRAASSTIVRVYFHTKLCHWITRAVHRFRLETTVRLGVAKPSRLWSRKQIFADLHFLLNCQWFWWMIGISLGMWNLRMDFCKLRAPCLFKVWLWLWNKTKQNK